MALRITSRTVWRSGSWATAKRSRAVPGWRSDGAGVPGVAPGLVVGPRPSPAPGGMLARGMMSTVYICHGCGRDIGEGNQVRRRLLLPALLLVLGLVAA